VITARQAARPFGRRRPPPARAGRPEASGINHRCGAQLTLREAAAAAGGPLETLLATVSGAVRPPH